MLLSNYEFRVNRRREGRIFLWAQIKLHLLKITWHSEGTERLGKVCVCHGVQYLQSCFAEAQLCFSRGVKDKKQQHKSDVHRAVHRNIISIVKPTRCTSVSNLFYFGMLASSQQYLFDKFLLLYVQS